METRELSIANHLNLKKKEDQLEALCKRRARAPRAERVSYGRTIVRAVKKTLKTAVCDIISKILHSTTQTPLVMVMALSSTCSLLLLLKRMDLQIMISFIYSNILSNYMISSASIACLTYCVFSLLVKLAPICV